MKNTNTKQFKNALKAFLLPMIEDTAEGYAQPMPEKPFSWLVSIAKSEVPHEFKKGDHAGLTYWLSGMGLCSLPCYYSEIIAASEQLHDCKLTEKQVDMVYANWFPFMANQILQFASKE